MATKVMDMLPKEGNLAGKTYKQAPSPSVTKKSFTEVPKKNLSDMSAKASAKAQSGKGSFNGSNTSGSGRRSD